MEPINKIIGEMERKMKKSVEVVHNEFSTIRTGKASPALVENFVIDYYGTQTRLKELAGISTPEPRLLVIQPWDPTVLSAVEKAILQSELGITPNVDGKVIRVPIPELSAERRQSLDKMVKKMAEDGRIAVRNVRHEANEEVKKLHKDKEIGEDDMYRGEEDVQKKTKHYIEEIDKLLKAKEKEILEE